MHKKYKHQPLFYIVQYPDNNFYKIGFSRKISQRFYTLNRYSPIKILPIFVGYNGIIKEKIFKQKYRPVRLENKEFYILNNIVEIANEFELIPIDLENIMPAMEREHPVIFFEMDIFYTKSNYTLTL